MSSEVYYIVVVVLGALAGALIWHLVLDSWRSRVPKRYFGSLTPTEGDVARGLNKADDEVKQCYADLDYARAVLEVNASRLSMYKNTAEELEGTEDALYRFVVAKKALDRALKARDRACGWAFLHGFGVAVVKHIKNPAATAEEMDALPPKPNPGSIMG